MFVWVCACVCVCIKPSCFVLWLVITITTQKGILLDLMFWALLNILIFPNNHTDSFLENGNVMILFMMCKEGGEKGRKKLMENKKSHTK